MYMRVMDLLGFLGVQQLFIVVENEKALKFPNAAFITPRKSPRGNMKLKASHRVKDWTTLEEMMRLTRNEQSHRFKLRQRLLQGMNILLPEGDY